MTIINLTEIGPDKIHELAIKATLNGVLVEDLETMDHAENVNTGGGYTVYPFETTSKSDPSRFHECLIYKRHDGIWYGECDKDNEDGCEANHKGGKLCTHLAASCMKLKAMLMRKEKEDELGVG